MRVSLPVSVDHGSPRRVRRIAGPRYGAETNAEGEFNPTYRCLFPNRRAGTVPPAPRLACWRARRRAGIDDGAGGDRELVAREGLVGRLLMVDARAMRFETLRYQRDRPTRSMATRRRSWI